MIRKLFAALWRLIFKQDEATKAVTSTSQLYGWFTALQHWPKGRVWRNVSDWFKFSQVMDDVERTINDDSDLFPYEYEQRIFKPALPISVLQCCVIMPYTIVIGEKDDNSNNKTWAQLDSDGKILAVIAITLLAMVSIPIGLVSTTLLIGCYITTIALGLLIEEPLRGLAYLLGGYASYRTNPNGQSTWVKYGPATSKIYSYATTTVNANSDKSIRPYWQQNDSGEACAVPENLQSAFTMNRRAIGRNLNVLSKSYKDSGELTKANYARRVATWFTASVLLFGVLVAASVLSGGFFPAFAGMGAMTSAWIFSGTVGVGLMGLFATIDALRGGPDFKNKHQDGYQKTAFSAGKRWGYFGRLLFASFCISLVIAVAAVATPALPGAVPVFAGLFASAKFGLWAQMGVLAASVFGAMTTMHGFGAAFMALSTRFSKQCNPRLRATCRWFSKAFSFFAFSIAGISVISSIAPATLAAFKIATTAKTTFLALLQTLGIASGIYIAFNAAVSLCAAGVAYWANKPGFVAGGMMGDVSSGAEIQQQPKPNNHYAPLGQKGDATPSGATHTTEPTPALH